MRERRNECWVPLLVVTTLLAVPWLSHATISSSPTPPSFLPRQSKMVQGLSSRRGLHRKRLDLGDSTDFDLIQSLRAGAIEGSDDDDETDNTDEEDDDVYDDEYDEYDEEGTEETEAEEEEQQVENVEVIYDEPFHASMSLQLGTTIGVITLCRRVDLYDPKVVRLARFAFIAYMVLMQVFLAYVRIKARIANDRTPITLSNPLTSLVQNQIQQTGGSGGGNDMVKEMASQFLSSKSTVLEYDLKQVKSMNGALLFNLLFMWILHFKMNQVQPLFLQVASGVRNLVFSPLFQAYVLGRNLERPFKNPRLASLQAKMEADRNAMAESANATSTDATHDDSKQAEDAPSMGEDEEESDTEEEAEAEAEESDTEEEVEDEETSDESEVDE